MSIFDFLESFKSQKTLVGVTIKLPKKGWLRKQAIVSASVTPKDVRKQLKISMDAVLRMHEKKHEAKMFDNKGGVTKKHGRKKLGIRSEKLKGSYKHRDRGKVSVKGNKITGTRGSKNKYAGVHEYGATIKAKGNWLWIHVGEHKMSPRVFRKRKHFYLESAKGKTAMLITGKGSAKDVTPVFALRKKVNIPKRDILLQSFREMKKPAAEILQRGIVELMEGKSAK